VFDIENNYEWKNFNFYEAQKSERNQMLAQNYEDMINVLDEHMTADEPTENLHFDSYMLPLPHNNVCWYCGGRVFTDQLYLPWKYKYRDHRHHRQHAICVIGYGGYEYSYKYCDPKESEIKYTGFHHALLEIFEISLWLNTYDHTDYIWEKMEKKGFRIWPTQRTASHLVSALSRLNKDIFRIEHTKKGETVYWYIHRCNWPKPEEINWKAHIVEILKAKRMIPLLDFDSWERHPEVPGKLLAFIKQYTTYPSFERAVRDIPIVEIIYLNSKPFVRLKEQANFLVADTSQHDLEMESPPKMLSSCLCSTIDHKKTLSDYSTQDIKDKDGLIYKGTYNTNWAPPGENRKQEEVHAGQSLPETSSPFDKAEFIFKGTYNTNWAPPGEKNKMEEVHETSSLFDNNSYQEDSDNDNQI
jgi:hypothetical protein